MKDILPCGSRSFGSQTIWFNLPYQAIGWIGGLCALAGCWFFARYSPFPAVIRVLLPFTYFIAFQYAIVARPYVLFPLFAFMAAYLFADAERRPWRFIAALSALALLCAAGVMLASGLIAARAWYAFRSWKQIPAKARKQLLIAAVVFSIVLAFVAFVNWPPSDRSFARFDRPADENFGLSNLPREISAALFGSFIPSAALLLVVGAYSAYRHRFLTFVLPTAFVLVFFTKVYGYLWHSGALTVIVITALWIAWPREEKAIARPRLQTVLNALVLLGLAGLVAVQICWTARTLVLQCYKAEL
jgi:fumarate reductase subunit D